MDVLDQYFGPLPEDVRTRILQTVSVDRLTLTPNMVYNLSEVLPLPTISLDAKMAYLQDCLHGNDTPQINPAFVEERTVFNRQLKLVTTEEEEDIGPSIFKCARCGSNKIKYQFIQQRSVDEPATQHFRCVDCGNKWQK